MRTVFLLIAQPHQALAEHDNGYLREIARQQNIGYHARPVQASYSLSSSSNINSFRQRSAVVPRSDDDFGAYDYYYAGLQDETSDIAIKKVSRIAGQARDWIENNVQSDYIKRGKLDRAIKKVEDKLLKTLSRPCAKDELTQEESLALQSTFLSAKRSTAPLDEILRFTTIWRKMATTYLVDCPRMEKLKNKIFKFQKQFVNHLDKSKKD
ncbi:Oidioi.mRNA.OKI2018_I69.chr2.g4642.t1.cds [Oikopleura dioica]|uniref:Oidioi.mRNA.OKI2018_I69.chr2.g4642.t1.cds n=1 Tax=Oikopleura dioica TaxID=34765 RepID=A0ABN7T1S4_OIKDI|nr:Oidioi.mRNA.OKI2018_I69.chr2.g4642.t1.cds [Oikopleura dioica]